MAERASAGKGKKGKRAKTKNQADIVDLAKARQKANKEAKVHGKPGHNSGEVADDVVLKHISAIDNADKAFQSAKGKLQNAWSAAKEAGINTDALKQARKQDAKDHGATVITYVDTGRYLKLMGSPLGTQFNLFSGVEKPAPERDPAVQGLEAAANGLARDDNPHTPGSADFALWDQSFLDGQEQAAAGPKH
jgi:hypothetical protein